MTGLIIHPLRLAALDRLKVLRVPFKVQPKKEAAIIDRELMDTKGVYQTWLRNPDGGIDQDFNAQYFKPPYAPGERFIKEKLFAECYASKSWNYLTYEDGEEVLAEIPPDWCPPINAVRTHRESGDNIHQGGFDWYTATVASMFMPEWASRYIVTLGNPVPYRLGEVDVVQQRDEGVIIEIGDEYRRTWDALYPRHPYSPDLWTWGYPMEVRR